MFACALLTFGGPVLADSAPQDDPGAIFSAAHHALGGGVTFTPETCAKAAPLLDQAIALTATNPGHDVTRSFARLESGYCKLVEGAATAAAALFTAVVAEAAPQPADDVNILGYARACLAHLYARGSGVPGDPEKAIGLYVLSEGYRCM
ncbi:hypothetical protein FGG78_42825, partial [Thioclava sp. BHET1]